jgi:hypothetical protein
MRRVRPSSTEASSQPARSVALESAFSPWEAERQQQL